MFKGTKGWVWAAHAVIQFIGLSRYGQAYTNQSFWSSLGLLELDLHKCCIFGICNKGWRWGGVRWGFKMGSSFLSRMVFSCSIIASSRPILHDGKNFPTPSPPLGALRSPTSLRKTLLFVNLPYNYYNFSNETYFINKNILEITTKFIPSNQINFQKKLNNISNCLTRQS